MHVEEQTLPMRLRSVTVFQSCYRPVSHVFGGIVNLASCCHVALSTWHTTHLAKITILAWDLWEETVNVRTWVQFSGCVE